MWKAYYLIIDGLIPFPTALKAALRAVLVKSYDSWENQQKQNNKCRKCKPNRYKKERNNVENHRKSIKKDGNVNQQINDKVKKENVKNLTDCESTKE